ncbi:MAG: YcbK family protein [Sphingomonas sp.]|nr:YcbK family protein [Sphingomonas sp.]
MLDLQLGRRGLLGGALAIGAASLVGGRAFAALPEKRIAFRNIHTNDTVDARFFGADGWDHQGLAELNHGLRDWRNNETTVMDPQLMLLLSAIRDKLGVAPQTKIDLISGYRSPQTNSALRAAGGEHTGVASKSQHMLGKATDIHMPGIALENLHLAALSMRGGGVGYYPKDGFVHVDTGRVRIW